MSRNKTLPIFLTFWPWASVMSWVAGIAGKESWGIHFRCLADDHKRFHHVWHPFNTLGVFQDKRGEVLSMGLTIALIDLSYPYFGMYGGQWLHKDTAQACTPRLAPYSGQEPPPAGCGQPHNARRFRQTFQQLSLARPLSAGSSLGFLVPSGRGLWFGLDLHSSPCTSDTVNHTYGAMPSELRTKGKEVAGQTRFEPGIVEPFLYWPWYWVFSSTWVPRFPWAHRFPFWWMGVRHQDSDCGWHGGSFCPFLSGDWFSAFIPESLKAGRFWFTAFCIGIGHGMLFFGNQYTAFTES